MDHRINLYVDILDDAFTLPLDSFEGSLNAEINSVAQGIRDRALEEYFHRRSVGKSPE
jgi:hypothetical protein